MNDTELATRLADCLHQYADPVTTSPGMVSRVNQRSRQLRRNRHAAAALAIAPITAGVAVGAVALSAGNATHHGAGRVSLRTLDSTSPTTTPSPTVTPTDLSDLTDVCAAGTVPHLDVTDQPAPSQPDLIRQIVNGDRANGDPEIMEIRPTQVGSDSVALTKNGQAVAGDALMIASSLKDGSVQRIWQAAIVPAGQTETTDKALSGPLFNATFVGCVTPSAG